MVLYTYQPEQHGWLRLGVSARRTVSVAETPSGGLAELDVTGEVFLRMLADAHADHPDYRPEWHPLP